MPSNPYCIRFFSIFASGSSAIYGRQILYFVDPVFSKRAKVKAPGVAEGFSRGLSASLYFPMPMGDSRPSIPAAPDTALPEGGVQTSPENEGDFADEYEKLLAE